MTDSDKDRRRTARANATAKAKSQLNVLLARLTPLQEKKHTEAIDEGYKDEKCPKCGQWFLAHHHFVHCALVACGDCPMVEDKRSVLERFLGDEC